MASGPRSSSARCLFAAFLVIGALTIPRPAAAQSTAEYRGFWVETFNTKLGTRADIDRVIGAAVDSKANALFAQIRRRGDSWYLDSLEPLTQVAGVGEPGANGTWTVDPLDYLIERAHLNGIEVHAFVIVGSIYNAHPIITGLPKDPRHAFNQHFWDKAANSLYADTDPRQWSTRSLPHNYGGTITTFNGHRYGGEWYVDLGHPDAEAYTVDVLTHLVSRYDIDGLHLDRIRYPEAPIDKPTASLATWGINVGYNETSVLRFKARHGASAGYYTTADIGQNVSPASPAAAIITAADVGYPRTNDPLWNDWRREQVSAFVKRLYLNVTAVKPRIKVSAALICFWTGPVASGGWERTEAYYRVFQDWQGWAQEGTLDILAPMIYKREHSNVERPQFDDWLSFSKSLALSTGRHAMPGLGPYLNGVEGTLRQSRRSLARAPFNAATAPADGIIFYALGDTNPGTLVGNSTSAAVPANPFSYPTAGVSTPKRTNANFFSAVTSSANAAGTVLFEDPGNGPLFTTPVPVPDMPWKSAPTQGHVMGFARLADGTPLDGASVIITSTSSGVTRITKTDGGGFYGVVGLTPGGYRVQVEQGAVRLSTCPFDVIAGAVSSADARVDSVSPSTTAAIDPASPLGDNGWYIGDVRVSLAATDDCSGIARTEYSVNGGATWQVYDGGIVLSSEGVTVLSYRSVDAAGNTETAASITVRIDTIKPAISLTADLAVLWPPNGQMVPVTLTGSVADSSSGLAGVTYQIVDEYGMGFSIAPRALGGSSGTWSDVVALEARREGADLDGRQYTIVATVRDVAGNTATATVGVLVPHDRRRSGGR